MFYLVFSGLIYFVQLAQGIIIAYTLLSWFVHPSAPLMRFLTQVTDPVLNPIRAMLFRSTRSYRSATFASVIAWFAGQLLIGLLQNLQYRL